jgi:hypothetical protein
VSPPFKAMALQDHQKLVDELYRKLASSRRENPSRIDSVMMVESDEVI